MMNLLIFLQVWRLYNGFIAVLSWHSFGFCRSRNTPSFSKVFSSLLAHHSWCIVRFWILQEAQGKFYHAKTLWTISCNCRRYNVPRSLPQDAWHLGIFSCGFDQTEFSVLHWLHWLIFFGCRRFCWQRGCIFDGVADLLQHWFEQVSRLLKLLQSKVWKTVWNRRSKYRPEIKRQRWSKVVISSEPQQAQPQRDRPSPKVLVRKPGKHCDIFLAFVFSVSEFWLFLVLASVSAGYWRWHFCIISWTLRGDDVHANRNTMKVNSRKWNDLLSVLCSFQRRSQWWIQIQWNNINSIAFYCATCSPLSTCTTMPDWC